MKQKITISLLVNKDKCRAKAMKIAVTIPGVTSATSDAVKNQLVVTGDGVDSFALMKCLKRKFRCASFVSIEEVKPPPPPPPQPKPQPAPPKPPAEKNDKCCKICLCPCPCRCPPPYPCVQYYPVCEPVYDSNPSCSIQ